VDAPPSLILKVRQELPQLRPVMPKQGVSIMPDFNFFGQLPDPRLLTTERRLRSFTETVTGRAGAGAVAGRGREACGGAADRAAKNAKRM
jgi:hypothetical protein